MKKLKKHIAIVAPISAGKTTAINFFKSKGFIVYKLTEAIYKEADRRGFDRTNRVVLQDLGDEMRKIGGVDILARLAIKEFKKYPNQNFAIDSIRNHNELIALKNEYGELLLILAINAPIELRYKRAVARKGQYKEQNMSFEEFVQIDKRDLGIGNKDHEQNVAKCIEMADITIENSSSLESFIYKLVRLYNQYFK